MKKINSKYIRIFIIAFILIIAFTVKVQALDATQIFSDADSFIANGSTVDGHEGDIQEAIMPIGQVLVHIGGWVLVIATIVIGIKYALSTAQERAKLKTQLYGLVAAIFVIYGGQALWAALVRTFE